MRYSPVLLSLLFGWLLVATACQTELYPKPIRGTTYRIGEQKPADESEITIHIFDDIWDCSNQQVEDVYGCQPQADRSSGELRLGFFLRDPQTLDLLPRSLRKDEILVMHNDARQDEFELIPKEPIKSGQLFILVVDGSSSMFENEGERIQKVYQALLNKRVIAGFYPEDNNKTGVVIVRFNKEVSGLDGGVPRILKTPEQYEAMVKNHLMTRTGGFTHLYDAAKYAVTELLEQDKIREFLMTKSAEPTIVLLTDGFNNEQGRDTCGDNAPRLQAALDIIRDRRKSVGSLQPRVFAVGLGSPWNNKKKPKGFNQKVTASALCGQWVNNTINGGLEKNGIDHISLEWMAEVGGGQAFVRRNPKGLADVFQAAAAARYKWYQLYYRVPDNYYHRRSFEVQLRLQGYERAYTTVTIHPSGWLDAPTGAHAPGQYWFSPTPLRRSVALIMPILGLLVFLNFVGAATFNARRTIFRRAKPRK